MTDWTVDLDAVTQLIAERDAAPVGDRLTPRMEARRIIDAVDHARAGHPNGPEATIAALSEEVESLRDQLDEERSL